MNARKHLTFSNVVAMTALFLALTAGAYAAVKAHSVGTKQLKDNAVTSPKVKDGSLLSADFGAGQLPAPGTRVAWVVVASNGTILRQSGGFTVVHPPLTGIYAVDNPAIDESTTGYSGASYREDGGGEAPGFVTTRANSASGFQVRTTNAAGTPAELGFSIIAPLP